MAESAANVFLETLRDLLVEETKFLLSVGGDVEKVKGDLRSIHALLMRADRGRHASPTLKLYISQLKDLAFQAENLLETYAVEIQSKKEGRKSLKEKFRRYICIISECYSVHEVGNEARDIMSALADLASKLESELGRESSPLSRQEYETRQTYAHEVEHDFVGMGEDIEILVSKVKDETRRRRVVKIYGMGGLGKTTLARKVYNHTDLQSYARAWVCITQQFQPKAVFGEILRQLDSNAGQIDGMEDRELVTRIQSFSEGRKCLVVIDDIWKNDDWEIIRKAFPVNCNVILTTRSENIANQQSEPHKLKFLTEDEGWTLLQKITDISPADPDLKSFEDIGRVIVSKCEGLPLSVCVIGGILRQKVHTLPEWRRVNVDMGSYLRRGEGVEEYKRVNQVLDLSYDALPYYLKPCFLYLACFPEDAKIETERLYLLWMAEGFISYQDKGPNESLRDVARRYLTELAMRCMVQLHEAKTYYQLDKFDSCGLHDLMHDLCSSKAEAEEEKFVKRVDASKYLTDILSPTQTRVVIPPSIGNSVSRLAISCDFNSTVSSVDGLEEVKGLRSFTLLQKFFGTPNIGFKENTIDFKMSQYLRIFVADCCEFEGGMLPSKLGELIHLRYMSLRGSNVRELPKSVCSMPYLQTLDLRVPFPAVIRLPNVIWKIKRLKHLFLNEDIEVIGGEKLRLDGLQELETLDKITSETCCIADIPRLISLQRLCVAVCDVDSMSTVLSNKNRQLRETRVWVKSCDLCREKDMEVLNDGLMTPSLLTLQMERCNMSGRFPCYKQGMCQNLVSLELAFCKVKVDVVEFGKYPMLRELALCEVEIAETLTFHPNSFPQIEYLGLYELHDLRKWEVEEGAMPKLTSLTICECPNLDKVPDGLRSISTLRMIEITKMPRQFMERVNEEDCGPFV
ncbi:putative disease resistance protein [Salvia divinorum]|uniref:Disease resistance protein n=1 Tax=Salvia divinorum TaxID=28513 RepID=A0ABD1GXS0_SALDI